MQITRHTDGTTTERSGEALFQGNVWGRTLAGAPESEHLNAAIVNFAPGARTRMHQHTHDQLLYIVHGIGKVGTASEEYTVGVGDMVVVPAREDHWHGAGDTGSPMAHLTITLAESQTTITD